jgi:hypothetical protein
MVNFSIYGFVSTPSPFRERVEERDKKILHHEDTKYTKN